MNITLTINIYFLNIENLCLYTYLTVEMCHEYIHTHAMKEFFFLIVLQIIQNDVPDLHT